MKYGLLDPMPLDDGEDEIFLKCEECGLKWGSQESKKDYDCVEENGLCIDCLNNQE